jgi:hypothetical protein
LIGYGIPGAKNLSSRTNSPQKSPSKNQHSKVTQLDQIWSN